MTARRSAQPRNPISVVAIGLGILLFIVGVFSGALEWLEQWPGDLHPAVPFVLVLFGIIFGASGVLIERRHSDSNK